MRKKRIRHRKKVLKKVAVAVIFLVLISSAAWICLRVVNIFIRKPVVISPLATRETLSISKNIDNLLLKKHIPFSWVHRASDSSYIVGLSQGGKIIFSSKKDLSYQISSLQLILKRLTIEGKRLKSLDFRYDKPIIVF